MGTTKLYIGLNDKVTKKQELTAHKSRAIVISTLFEYGIEGFTFEIVEGVYKHHNGDVVVENTIVITICTDDDLTNLHLVIDDLKEKLNQECIMIEKYASYVRYI